MDKELRKFLDALRCPICKAQIDINSGIGKSRFHYVCVEAGENHYKFDINSNPNLICEEYVTVCHNKLMSVIHQGINNYITKEFTNIEFLIINEENSIVGASKQNPFFSDKKLFDFQSLDKEKIISKIKTLLLFQ